MPHCKDKKKNKKVPLFNPCPNVKILVQDSDASFPFPQGHVPLTPGCINSQVLGPQTTIFYGADVEPYMAVNPYNPCNVVIAWQQDRISNGGGLQIGISYTFDLGQTWGHTTIPQICQGGITQRLSDVWLSWSVTGQLYLNFLGVNATQTPGPNQQIIGVTISTDGGQTWSKPTVLVNSLQYLNAPTFDLGPLPDKNSITANGCSAYSVWEQFPTQLDPTLEFVDYAPTMISRTTDGGQTWTPATILYDPFPDVTAAGLSNGIQNDVQTLGNQIIVLPNCQLLNFMSRIYARPGATDPDYLNDFFPYQYTLSDIAVVRSCDNGATWTNKATIIFTNAADATTLAQVFTGGYTYDNTGNITGGSGTLLRTSTSTIPSVAISPKTGAIYVLRQTSAFRSDKLPEIGLSASYDGGVSWTTPILINKTPQNAPNPQAFTPMVAVTNNGYVGIIYSDFRNDPVAVPNTSTSTLTDTWLDIYQEVPCGGDTSNYLNFVADVRLSSASYIAQNGPTTTLGVMVNGDYSALTANGDRFYAAYTKSLPGPFSPPTVFYTAPDGSQVLVDNNHRQDVYMSVVQVN